MAEGQTIVLPRTEKPLGTYFFFVWIIHALDVFFGRMGTLHVIPDIGFLVLYTMIALLGAFGPFHSEDIRKTLRAFVMLEIVGLLAFFIPYLAYRVLTPAGASPYLIMSIITFAPVFPLFLWVTHANNLPRVARGFMTLYIFFWVFTTLYANPAIFQSAAAETARLTGNELPTVDPGELIISRVIKVKDTFLSLANATTTQPRRFLNQSLAAATGDAYTAKVDRNAKLKLGVAMGEVKSTQPTYSTGDRVGVFGSLTATTLEDPILITVNCAAKDGKGNNISTSQRRLLTPDTSAKPIEVLEQETVDIDCDWNPNAFPAGSATITLSADFDTTTLSYLKTYFMDRDRLRELRAAKIDPFVQYDIKDRNPVTIYTSGPVSIAMSFGTPPIGIDTTQDEYAGTLGITLKNEGAGKIQNISFVLVFVPKGFEITELTGNPAQITRTRCLDIQPVPNWCDDTVSNLYLIAPQVPVIEPGKTVSVRARARVHRTEYEDLLGATPISTKFFKAAAVYDYRLERSITVTVQGTTAGATSQGATTVVHLQGAPIVSAGALDANVTFLTDVAAATEVRYCRGSHTASCAPSAIRVSSAPTVTVQHTHHLDFLEPSSLYAYDLYGYSSACPNGKCKLNDQPYTFTTGAAS